MSKDSGSFLRKVVRFVANPTSDWSALDAPASGDPESEYAKTEIKAMIERKRRNDFVRKRELDMLRKIRREGLNPDASMAMVSPSNLGPESRPQSGARSIIGVKAKIDEIELQMVGVSARPMPASSPLAGDLPTMPGGLNELTATAPDLLNAPTIPFGDNAATIINEAQASDDAAQAYARPQPSGDTTVSGGIGVRVTEMAHDPELDEAVISFANADFDQCEQCLYSLIHPAASRHDHAETWLALFDFYRALDLPQKFDHLALSYAQQFGVSAPQWYSLPHRLAKLIDPESDANPTANLAQDLASHVGATEGGPFTEGPGGDHAQPGWIAPPILDSDAVAQLRVTLLQLPRPWRIDWQGINQVTPQAAHQLGVLLRQWAEEPLELIWVGTPHFLEVLEELTPTGSRDADPAHWMLRLDVLRMFNQPTVFDEVAIDYCVTFEQSPPSWEPTRCTIREQSDAISAPTAPMSLISEVTTSFVESQLHQELSYVQVAALQLSGQLVGDIGLTLRRLDDQLGASISLEVDCSNLLRVDFIAAGDLLNWVLARRAEDRLVVFLNPHRLIALFFGAMGINEHATVKMQAI
jgi:hypothetical protein